MRTNSVIDKCKENGIKISRQGLYNRGLKYGFIKSNGSKGLLFIRVKFEEWLKMMTEPIPEGYYSIKILSEKNNFSTTQFYMLIKKYDINVKKIRGRIYVREGDFKNAIKRYRQNQTEFPESVH